MSILPTDIFKRLRDMAPPPVRKSRKKLKKVVKESKKKERKYPGWFAYPEQVEQFIEMRFPLTRDICMKMVRGVACDCKQCEKHVIARRGACQRP